MKFDYKWSCNGKTDKGTINAIDEGSAEMKIRIKVANKLKTNPDNVVVSVFQLA